MPRYYDCDGNCLVDTDSDGVCDELEVEGCTDAAACNYAAEATEDDGTCEYAELTRLRRQPRWTPTATGSVTNRSGGLHRRGCLQLQP